MVDLRKVGPARNLLFTPLSGKLLLSSYEVTGASSLTLEIHRQFLSLWGYKYIYIPKLTILKMYCLLS